MTVQGSFSRLHHKDAMLDLMFKVIKLNMPTWGLNGHLVCQDKSSTCVCLRHHVSSTGHGLAGGMRERERGIPICIVDGSPAQLLLLEVFCSR